MIQVLSALHKDIQGRWTSVYCELDGEIAHLDSVLELHGDEFKVSTNNTVTHEGRFTVGPGTPAEIVLIYSKSSNPLFLGGPRPGVFQLQGDTLKLNFGAVGHSGPRTLNTTEGSESVLSVYKRDSRTADAAISARKLSILKSVALW